MTLTKCGWFIYHSDQILKEIPNLITKIWNLFCSTYYSHFDCSATVREAWISPNVDDLYVSLIEFSRRFWIWSPKFKIPSVASATAIFIVQPPCEKCDPHQIEMTYISVWPNFQGDSESGHSNLKFTLWHMQWPLGNVTHTKTIFILSWVYFLWDSESGESAWCCRSILVKPINQYCFQIFYKLQSGLYNTFILHFR